VGITLFNNSGESFEIVGVMTRSVSIAADSYPDLKQDTTPMLNREQRVKIDLAKREARKIKK
jgi:hypothetical protein